MNQREDTLQKIAQRRLIAIVRGLDPALLGDMAHALLLGGVDTIEVTFAQNRPESWQDTAKGISRLNTAFDGKILAGAGTVLTEEQVKMAYDAGARYIVTPNVDGRVISAALKLGMVTLPGALTPTEIVTAHEMGADFVKVFPAGSLGPGYIKALKGPLSHIPLMAVGGVNENNTADFLRAGAVGVGVGGNLVNSAYIRNNEPEKITNLAAAYVRAIGEV